MTTKRIPLETAIAGWRKMAIDCLIEQYDLPDVIRSLLRPAPDSERTGMPCPDCAARQKRIDISRQPDGSLTVRIAYHIPADKVVSEVKGLVALLKNFGR